MFVGLWCFYRKFLVWESQNDIPLFISGVCVYNGRQYSQGQVWYDGCSYKCTCDDAYGGIYRCVNRCVFDIKAIHLRHTCSAEWVLVRAHQNFLYLSHKLWQVVESTRSAEHTFIFRFKFRNKFFDELVWNIAVFTQSYMYTVSYWLKTCSQ